MLYSKFKLITDCFNEDFNFQHIYIISSILFLGILRINFILNHIINLSNFLIRKVLKNMNKLKSKQSHDLAKKMIIEGETFNAVMSATNLRLKDLKRIQREEIDTHF